MGSQWPGMARHLLRVPVFRAAMQRCHDALKPHGVDLLHIVTTEDKNIYDNILHSFVGIAAVQIGLTDVLKAMGVEPDGIIGHSVGELGCGYADGCFTAEQMVLAAHARGRASIETELIRGTMAAVGLGYSEVSPSSPTPSPDGRRSRKLIAAAAPGYRSSPCCPRRSRWPAATPRRAAPSPARPRTWRAS